MTQYIRPAQAFGAVSAAVAQGASAEAVDLAYLHKMIGDKLSGQKGTTRYGSIRRKNTDERYLLVPDSVKAALDAAGVDLSDARYNSNVDPTGLSATSETPPYLNDGLRRQVIIAPGNSFWESTTGSGAYPDLLIPENRMWAKGMGQPAYVVPDSNSSFTYTPSSAPNGPQFAMTYRWAHEKSRIVFASGSGGARGSNQPGYTYTQGKNFLDNFGQLKGLVLRPGQQGVFFLPGMFSNDVVYGDQSPNPGMGGASGSPNAVDNSMIPLIAKIKTEYPALKIAVMTEKARFSTGATNSKYNDIAERVIAQKAALGIDFILDTREIIINGVKRLDCRTPSVTTDTNYYQGDETHVTPLMYAGLDPWLQAFYDHMLGFTQAPPYAAAFK